MCRVSESKSCRFQNSLPWLWLYITEMLKYNLTKYLKRLWASCDQLFYPFVYPFYEFHHSKYISWNQFTNFHFQKRLVNYCFTNYIWIAKIPQYQLMTKHLKKPFKCFICSFIITVSRSPVLQNDCSDWGWWFSFSYLLNISVVSACSLVNLEVVKWKLIRCTKMITETWHCVDTGHLT